MDRPGVGRKFRVGFTVEEVPRKRLKREGMSEEGWYDPNVGGKNLT